MPSNLAPMGVREHAPSPGREKRGEPLVEAVALDRRGARSRSGTLDRVVVVGAGAGQRHERDSGTSGTAARAGQRHERDHASEAAIARDAFRGEGSNLQHPAPKADVLPIELPRRRGPFNQVERAQTSD